MKLSIVYDNEAKEGFISDWGFSCFIDSGDWKILFDTGASAEILAHNMRLLGLQKEDIAIIALSHNHWDHIGGVEVVLHPEVAVWLPRSFPLGVKQEIAKNAARIVEVSEPREIVPGVYTTGDLGGSIKEQSLVLETHGGEGVVVLTGCAHPGLESILAAATTFGELYGVIGGFHGFDTFESLQRLKLIMPCHCTVHKRKIAERYPERTVWCGAGEVIEI